MAKINLKKPFITAVISSVLFAGAIVAVPLIASAENESNLVLNESLNDVDSNEGKDDKERSPRDNKSDKEWSSPDNKKPRGNLGPPPNA